MLLESCKLVPGCIRFNPKESLGRTGRAGEYSARRDQTAVCAHKGIIMQGRFQDTGFFGGPHSASPSRAGTRVRTPRHPEIVNCAIIEFTYAPASSLAGHRGCVWPEQRHPYGLSS